MIGSLSHSLTISILIVESWRSGPTRRRTTRQSRSRIIVMQWRLHRNRPPIRLSPSTPLLFLRGLFSFSSNFCLFTEKTITRKKEVLFCFSYFSLCYVDEKIWRRKEKRNLDFKFFRFYTDLFILLLFLLLLLFAGFKRNWCLSWYVFASISSLSIRADFLKTAYFVWSIFVFHRLMK